MNTLWVFGDSFAESQRAFPFKDTSLNRYYERVSNHYGYDLVNTGLGGASNEHIIDKFLQHVSKKAPFNQIKENDIVLFLPTSYGRKWIFEKHPSMTSYFSFIKKKKDPSFNLTDEDKSHAEKILLDVFSPFEKNKAENYIKMMVSTVSDYKTKIGFKALVINTFETNLTKNDNLIISSGFLHRISNKEFVGIEDFHKDYMDFRSNHLSPQNHTILANKIIESLESGKKLDLTTGFVENIIRKEDIEDKYKL